MTWQDLAFITLVLLALATLFAAIWFALHKQFARCGVLLLKLLVSFAAYMTLVITVSFFSPRRTIKIGDPQCFDDWCITLAGFERVSEGTRVAYRLDLRLRSRARRISQRENNLAVYLTDQNGRRYDPADSSDSFNVLLAPQQAVVVSRSFLIPADAKQVSAVITHEGGFPIGWFIIGYDTCLRKPPIARLR